MLITSPQSKEDFERYYDLRWRILRMPWNQPKGSEKDELEKESFHSMVCETDRIPIGIGRLHFNSEDEARIRYMAVEEQYRGRGIGKIILAGLEEKAINMGAKQIMLDAREPAIPFYCTAGYTIIGPAHTLYGCIKHVKMIKRIERENDQKM
ncbi:MAG TPA: GNAT family N-acetyltransferase [Anaerolineae bacterium]|nr:GNAT family N-acetyltransferase [Anaerolineae bacterium]